MSNFILRVMDGQSYTGVVSKLTGNATLSSFVDLISNSDLDANPRKAKKSSVTDDIEETLKENPELYPFMSKGVLFAASSVKPLERSRFSIEVDNPHNEGVLDGGHNVLSIGRFILEETGYLYVSSVKSWEDLKEHWNQHRSVIESKRNDLPDMLVPIEILYPADTPSGRNDFEDSILAISAARNNNAQLKETSKANKAGLYNELKANIDPHLQGDIEWREGEGGRIKAADIVALSLIPLSALPTEDYPLVKTLRDNPNVIFSSKGKCVEYFNDFMNQAGVTQKVTGDRIVELIDERVKSALTLMRDIPRLYDLIYARLPSAYNKASPGFGRISSVRTLDAEKWKSDKKSYMRQPAKTKFYQNDVEWQYPDGFLYPLVVGLAGLIEVKGNDVRWSKDPFQFIQEKLDIVLKSGFQSIIRSQNYDPAHVGKEKGSYELVSNMYRIAEHLK